MKIGKLLNLDNFEEINTFEENSEESNSSDDSQVSINLSLEDSSQHSILDDFDIETVINNDILNYYYKKINNINLRQQFELFLRGYLSEKNTIVKRQLINTCQSLYEYDKNTDYETNHIYLKNPRRCYGCNNSKKVFHGNYIFSCKDCGEKFQEYRNLKRDLTGQICLVVGARTKLGHQVVIKLLDAGAIVIGTSRYPEKAMSSFNQYKKYQIWKDRLFFYQQSLDLDVSNLEEIINNLYNYIDTKFGKLDVLINCAAQTIRAREKKEYKNIEDKNRYNDPKFVDNKNINSWDMKLCDLNQQEMEEVYRINAVAPAIIIQKMIKLLKKSTKPYIINVHAREGIISVSKSKKHIHTNMAKASLAMLTKCCIYSKLRTETGTKFCIHGCDPGWISIDEYYENDTPWLIAPLDEIDGAARILYPLFSEITNANGRTRRHFDDLLY